MQATRMQMMLVVQSTTFTTTHFKDKAEMIQPV
jgi:hypothetical protein